MRHREMRATTDKRQRHSRRKGAGCERVNDVRVCPARGDGQGARAARRARRGPVVDNGDRAVAGGVVVANEGRRGRRAKLMGDERPRTPADEDDGSAEGGRWQVGRQERCCRVSVVDFEKLWGVRGGWQGQAGKSGTMCNGLPGQAKTQRPKKRSSQVRSNKVRSPSEIEQSEIAKK